MIISKLITDDDNYDEIYKNDNYPGKISSHMEKINLDNYKTLYSYLDKYDVDNIIINDNEKNIDICDIDANDNPVIFDEFDYDINNNIDEEHEKDDTLISFSDIIDSADINNAMTNDNIIGFENSTHSSCFSITESEMSVIHKTDIKKSNESDKLLTAESIKELSKTEIIKNKEQEIIDLKKKLIKSDNISENLNIFIQKLGIHTKNTLYKKRVIVNYSKDIKHPIDPAELDDIESDKLDEIYRVIENINKNKSSVNLSTLLLQLIFKIIEKFLVDGLNLDIFKGISEEITSDFIEIDCEATSKFINDNINIPSYPFVDIFIKLLAKIAHKNISTIIKLNR
jgi:hypothetical protein